MAKVSLNKAAKETGVSLPTLSRWRKNGRISAEKNETGQGWLIDTSEYDRINSLKKSSPNMKHENSKMLKSVTHTEISMLQREIDMLKEERERERQQQEKTIEDLRNRLNETENERRKLTLMLMRPKKSLFARLLGK